MPRSEEAEWWVNAVHETVQLIPVGTVTTYGHIAFFLGERTSFPLKSLLFVCLSDQSSNRCGLRTAKRARQVGIALKHLPAEESGEYFHAGNVPWQRVINSKGMISHRCLSSRLT